MTPTMGLVAATSGRSVFSRRYLGPEAWVPPQCGSRSRSRLCYSNGGLLGIYRPLHRGELYLAPGSIDAYPLLQFLLPLNRRLVTAPQPCSARADRNVVPPARVPVPGLAREVPLYLTVICLAPLRRRALTLG